MRRLLPELVQARKELLMHREPRHDFATQNGGNRKIR
jgi:hypothetical protein